MLNKTKTTLGVYFNSLDGFYRLEVQGEQFRVTYFLPRRVRILEHRQIAEITQRPAYRGL